VRSWAQTSRASSSWLHDLWTIRRCLSESAPGLRRPVLAAGRRRSSWTSKQPAPRCAAPEPSRRAGLLNWRGVVRGTPVAGPASFRCDCRDH
jgi:hypothetical protein